MNETIWICVYRDTIEQHNDSNNLTEVKVTMDFFKQYFNECQKEHYDSMEDFLNEYTADDTENFYHYAIQHNAVLDKEDW